MNKQNKYILKILTIIIAVILILYASGNISFDNLGNAGKSLSVSSAGKSSNGNSQSQSKLLAVGDVCVPDAGYDYCDEYIYSDYGVTATAKIMLSAEKAVKRYISGYYVGGAYEDVKMVNGDKLYRGRNVAWSAFDNGCNENGCSGTGINQLPSATYRNNLANPGQQYTDCDIYVAWDFAGSLSSSWVWAWSGYGVGGTGSCRTINAVNCYDATDCASNQYCNKAGTWQTWSCQPKECNIGETKCVGYDSYTCGTTDYKWKNGGKIIGKCGVQCLTNNNCLNLNNVSSATCSSTNPNEVITVTTTGQCSLTNYVCSGSQTVNLVETCSYGCTDAKCNGFPIWIIVIAVVIIGGMIFLIRLILKRRKK